MKRRVTFSNEFHNTTATVLVQGDTLTLKQIKRAKRKLCGFSACTCGDEMGRRGHLVGEPQRVEFQYSANTGKLLGAKIPALS